jgi:molybdopterin-guanine dinucleotide biosynthesis protein A
MIAGCTAVILAGGRSRRMGHDKATLRLGERTLMQQLIEVVAPLFPHLVVSVAAPRADLPWPQVCDVRPGQGPLGGLCAALGQVDTPWIFALATDMPFVAPALIEALAARRDCVEDAVVPRVHGHPQPLAAFYSTRCLTPFAALLEDDAGEASDARRRSLRAALGTIAALYVDEPELLAADPGLHSFFDLDTPQDLAAATRLAR